MKRRDVLICGLALLGLVVVAKPWWFWLPSMFAAPWAAVPLGAAGFLNGPLGSRSPRALALVAVGAMVVSVLWFTVASPLWLPAIIAQVPNDGAVLDTSAWTLTREGLSNGLGAALWAAIYFSAGGLLARMSRSRTDGSIEQALQPDASPSVENAGE